MLKVLHYFFGSLKDNVSQRNDSIVFQRVVSSTQTLGVFAQDISQPFSAPT